jgi:hypothetical protein
MKLNVAVTFRPHGVGWLVCFENTVSVRAIDVEWANVRAATKWRNGRWEFAKSDKVTADVEIFNAGKSCFRLLSSID